ncbi:MAG: hypothetical protein A2Z21_05385 [Candidatus Fraserbacteria bacterium RBG_16_55_9]|uniref:Double zinc ribbon domain-containing protein n=1 Tax=Fraserbacteria sp. (strain RBG_16_55_9) TaxID=1817864 RepID=A0A1F5V2N0_FRAXR|nr:MAG: hypothetical protein A2Z21_05385 [Candidatus Fraserbacteria bacterium RBG_16_55_9]
MSVRETLQAVGNGAVLGTLTLLYPPRCPLCEVPLEEDCSKGLRFVCEGCLSQIQRVMPPWCARCGDPLEEGRDLCVRCAFEKVPFECARSFGLYEGVLARLTQRLKFQKEPALTRELAPLLAQALEQEGLFQCIEGITFVPMSRRSLWARGFNQSQLLAQRLGALVDKPVFATLWKHRETRPQVELSGQERLENLRGAFAPLRPAQCERILLIDDVYTTGATTTECSRALQSAGYPHVYVLTLARAPISSGR